MIEGTIFVWDDRQQIFVEVFHNVNVKDEEFLCRMPYIYMVCLIAKFLVSCIGLGYGTHIFFQNSGPLWGFGKKGLKIGTNGVHCFLVALCYFSFLGSSPFLFFVDVVEMHSFCQSIFLSINHSLFPSHQSHSLHTLLVRELLSVMDNYIVLEHIGEGSFGKVYKARRKNTGFTVAMKFISKHGKSEKDLKNLRQEIGILRKLNHENIILMFDTFETEREFCVVTEYAQGELFDILQVRRKRAEGRERKREQESRERERARLELGGD